VRLWQAAEGAGNTALAHLIKIAAYTGGRREGIAHIRVSDVKADPKTGVPFMHIEHDKTSNGHRDVPIHSNISDLIDRLIHSADAEGYLIRSTAKNKYGLRGSYLGAQFSR
jgi:hypothetical protein